MSVKDIKGINVEIGGTVTKLDEALKKSDTAANGLQSELTQVNRLLKFDPQNTELLAQKQKLLTQEITQTSEKLKILKTAQEQYKNSHSNLGTEEYRALEREIAAAEQKVKSLETQQKNMEVTVSKTLAAAGEKWEKYGEKISKAGTSMLPVTLAVGAAGTAAVKYASDAEESANKVDVAFGSAAKNVHNFSDTTLDSYGIAKGTAEDMASLFGDMATSMKIAPDAAADMSTSLVGLAGDLASFKNIGIDEAQSALKGIFTGETESLKNLGVVMTQTNLDAFAMANGFGKTTAQMTEAEKVQLRYAYVMDATKNAQGDFARTSDGTANSLRTAQEAVKELAANFGALLLPIVAKVVQKITETIKRIGDMSAGQKKAVLVVMALAAAIGPLLILIGKMATGVGVLMKVGAKLTPLFTGTASAAGGAATATGLLGKAIAVLTGPIGIAVAAIAALVAACVYLFNTNQEFHDKVIEIWENVKNKIMAVVETVKPVLQTFADFFGMLWDAIKQIFDAAMQALAPILTSIFDLFNTVFNAIYEKVMPLVQFLVDFIQQAWGACKDGVGTTLNGIFAIFKGVFGLISTTISGIVNIIVDLINGDFTKLKADLTATLQVIWNGILGFFRGLPGTLAALGSSMFSGMANGISSMAGSVYSAATGCINSAISWIIGLPGQAFTWGLDMINGFANGIYAAAQAVVDKVKNIASTIASYLHFSCPDVGPLSEYESWMPDFMRGLAAGIERNKYKVVEAVKGLTNGIAVNIGTKATGSPALVAPGGGTMYQTNYISSPKALTPSETARHVRAQTQRMVAKLKK
ncbi:MAG: hypothetical protein RR998_08330 [Oscillospiraceae bacterium]